MNQWDEFVYRFPVLSNFDELLYHFPRNFNDKNRHSDSVEVFSFLKGQDGSDDIMVIVFPLGEVDQGGRIRLFAVIDSNGGIESISLGHTVRGACSLTRTAMSYCRDFYTSIMMLFHEFGLSDVLPSREEFLIESLNLNRKEKRLK